MSKKINEKLLQNIQVYEVFLKDKINNDEKLSDEDIAILDKKKKKIIQLSEIVKIYKES